MLSGRHRVSTLGCPFLHHHQPSSTNHWPPRAPGLPLIGRSVSLGPLGALRAGSTAGGLVVGIDAEAGLDHHHTVVTSVPAVFICDLWAAGYRVAHLLLLRFGVRVALRAVLLLWSQTSDLPHLHTFTTRARARAPLGGEPLRQTLSHLTLLHRCRFVQVSALGGRYDGEIVPQLLDTNDVSSLGSFSTRDITLTPGAAVPDVRRHTRASIAGLHLGRFLPDTVASSSSFSDASSGQTHHLPLLNPRTALSRTSVGPAGEVPVGHTGAHVALLVPLWAEPGVALFVVDHAALIADAPDAPGPAADATVHRTRAPVRADLPVRAELQLAGLGGLRGREGGAALRVDHGGSVTEALPALELPLLHAGAAGNAAFGPGADLPEWRAGLRVAGLLLWNRSGRRVTLPLRDFFVGVSVYAQNLSGLETFATGG